jgi:hypothetical protein
MLTYADAESHVRRGERQKSMTYADARIGIHMRQDTYEIRMRQDMYEKQKHYTP